ncbi:MAG: 4Fe-4S dicluster domain-containing protein [Mycobacterium leprae]
MKLALDAGKCSGCRACELVCALENFGVLNPKKAALRVTGHFPVPGRYTLEICDQCGDCAQACPTECIQQDEKGAYVIDRENCIACGACVDACPKGVMYLHDDFDGVPIKCNLCGKCVEFCPQACLIDADGAILPRR